MGNQLEIVLFPCLNDNYGFLIHDNDTGETVSIDTPEVDKIVAACSERAWSLTQIWNTHHHADHIGGLDDLRPFCYKIGELPIFLNEITLNSLKKRFEYIFDPAYKYPGAPTVVSKIIHKSSFVINGLEVIPIEVFHGKLPNYFLDMIWFFCRLCLSWDGNLKE